MFERLEHHRVLAFEVRVETTDGQAGGAHHFAHAGIRRATLHQCGAGRLEDAFAGLSFFIVHRCLRILRLEYYSHNNIPQVEDMTAGLKHSVRKKESWPNARQTKGPFNN
ncbi:hypothetical protein EMIT093MI4_10595 [Pseudomonas sp. IT-93MI4]